MPGDPRECRRHALRCAELVVSAGPQQLKAALLELPKNWEQLAIELENGSATLDDHQRSSRKWGSRRHVCLPETQQLISSRESVDSRAYWASSSDSSGAL